MPSQTPIPETMKAMVLEAQGTALVEREISVPAPGPGDILIKVGACAVCRTDLHVVDGELTRPKLPLVPGHEIIGEVCATGTAVSGLALGDRVGVPWLGGTCGTCAYCRRGDENLCASAEFTGYTRDGGFADYVLARADFVYPVPSTMTDQKAAPLMCAGLIGSRAYHMVPDARRLGLYGFGAAAHILAQVAVFEGKEVYAFTRPGDEKGQAFARSLGAAWAGASHEAPPQPLDAAIIFAPVGGLVPLALKAVDKGGTVVCAGIHMSDIPQFPYEDLWQERVIRSVANLTRKDGEQFLEIAPRVPVETTVHVYPLTDANRALSDLRDGAFEGAAVLVPGA